MTAVQGEKVAVVLFQLGGPDKAENQKPFLYNFFMDPNVVALPQPFRWLLATFIANRRSRKEAAASYGELGGATPLLANTEKQRAALQDKVAGLIPGGEVRVFTCMRYWPPHQMTEAVMKEVQAFNPDRVVCLPLYPQFSGTTSGSSWRVWQLTQKKLGFKAPHTFVCCHPTDPGYLEPSLRHLKAAYESARAHGKPRVLFSAHSLPEDYVRKGDPYQKQCEQSAYALADGLQRVLGIDDLDWRICYQSRVGLQKWIGPATGEEIAQAGRDGVPLVVYPHAFVSEHVETLVEIGVEYRQEAEQAGVPHFERVPTVMADDAYIAALARQVRLGIDRSESVVSNEIGRICPDGFAKCPCVAPPGQRVDAEAAAPAPAAE